MNRHERVVVLKRMFTLQELEEDKSLLLDLKDDVREECSTLGEVTNVVLYDVRAFQLLHVDHSFNHVTGRSRRRDDSKVQRCAECPSMRNRESEIGCFSHQCN